MLSTVVSDQPAPVLPERRILKLAAGESLQYAVDIPHDDSVVVWYLQGADTTWKDRAATRTHCSDHELRVLPAIAH